MSVRPDPPRDDVRLARLYRECKSHCVGFARHLLASSGRNRYLCAFDAEEFYDEAWVVYYNRREYLADRDDHVARINALIRDRITDQRRRSQAQKRTVPGTSIDPAGAERYERAHAPELDSRLADRDHLRRLLDAVASTADARALLDHELGGLTFAEIGASAGITAEAARRRVQRAKAQARAAHEEAVDHATTPGAGHD
ncbi:MAG: RNA polymerase sigma factor [Acidimicrobiales bacterium]